MNSRGEAFLSTRVHSQPHRTTGVPPVEMLPLEARVRFDAAYVEPRRVHPVLPLVEGRGLLLGLAGRFGPAGRVPFAARRRPAGDPPCPTVAASGSPPRRWARSGTGSIAEPPRQRLSAAISRCGGTVAALEPGVTKAGDYAVEAVDLSRYELDGGGR